MTAKEAIEELSQYPPETIMGLRVSDRKNGDVFYELEDIMPYGGHLSAGKKPIYLLVCSSDQELEP